MTTFLDRIVETKADEVARLMAREAELRAAAVAVGPTRGFAAGLTPPGTVAVIAEFKRRSPSARWLGRGADPVSVSRKYAEAGAAAISVLTDEPHFGGTLADLDEVSRAVEIPVLRKDFVLHEAQVWEARVAGADAVLLIVRILDRSRLSSLLRAVEMVGMDALVEVHDRSELVVALDEGASVIGVNNRNLETFETDLNVSLELAPLVPPGVVLVAESGIRSGEDVDRVGRVGVDAVLVGEVLMRAGNEASGTAGLVGRGRWPRSAQKAGSG